MVLRRASDPFELHVVTGFTCDCARLPHHGAAPITACLLDHLGWLPDMEDEPALIDCADVQRLWEQWYRGRAIACRAIGLRWHGRVPDRRPQGLPAVVPIAQAGGLSITIDFACTNRWDGHPRPSHSFDEMIDIDTEAPN